MTPVTGTLRSLLSTPAPTIGVEIAARRVTAVSLARDRRGLVVTSHASEPLAEGVLRPSINESNVADPAALTDAVKRVLKRLDRRPTRVALVVPDTAAKVSLVRFEQVPPRQADLDQLVRWQVRKAAPFRIEDAQIAFSPGAASPEGGREFVVVMMRRDLVEEYERAVSNAGAHAGIVDLASLNLINLALAGAVQPTPGTADWLLVHVAADYSTLAIVRGEHLIFFRNRPADAEGHLADLVHQTAMYYEDRLSGTGLTRVVLASESVSGTDDASASAARRSLEGRLGTTVEMLDVRRAAALTDRISAGPELLDTLAAPVGVLLSHQTGQ
jgi:type IV pilus assembly protein PilM